VSDRTRDPAMAQGLHPWLRPLWRRLLILAALVGWMGFEFWYEPLGSWFYIVLAVTIYAVWELFLRHETGKD